MYKHTQIGGVTIISLLCIFAFFFLVTNVPHSSLMVGVMALLLVLFATLTVAVSPDALTVVFGIGLIRFTIAVSQIASVKSVRTKWWYGFGIHGWWGRGWLLNVSGLQAVEVRLKNGRVYGIGTDEPQQLLAALQSVIPCSGH